MKKLIIGGISLCLSISVVAQSGSADDTELKFCGSTEQRESLFKQYEPWRRQDSLDQVSFQKQYEDYLQTASSTRGGSSIYTIPVVFHIVHINGVENISDDQIYDAIEVLNRDFNKQNPDTTDIVSAFVGIAGNPQIEFRLATKDPQGNCHKGITRTYSPNTYDTGMTFNGHPIVEDVRAEHGTWPQNKYMNVFVCIDPDGAAGYTLTPSSWLPETDMYGGILMRHDYTGSIGTSNYGRSRTLTHEVGHWLNLQHTWGPNNNPGNTASCGDDDGVGDTPNTIGWQTCNLSGSTCSSLDNVQNYMEYAYCSRMFTDGQVIRMHSALNSGVAGRNDLWSNSNLSATGVLGTATLCEADFESDQIEICAGESIDFTDGSFHNPTSWTWTFNGGTPSSSTDQDPSGVVFTTPGTYDVTLVAGDGTNTETVTKTGYITVLPTDALPIPYFEGFESVANIPNGDLSVVNPDNNLTWQVTSTAAQAGTKSVYLNNTSANEGNTDDIISNTMDLSSMSSVVLSFDYAYAQRDNQDDDVFRVYVSKDCGKTWSIRKNMVGDVMATRSPTNSTFVPLASEWVHVDVSNITSSYFVEGFRFKFEFTSDGGNRFFLDNINLSGAVGIPSLTEEQISLQIYPNPVDAVATIAFDIPASRQVRVAVTDLLGREITVLHNATTSGTTKLSWDTGAVAAGTYLVQVIVDGQPITRKITVQ